MKPLTGLTLAMLEQRKEAALAELLDARQADFDGRRVTHSARTAACVAAYLLLEELVHAAVSLTDERKGNAKRDGGAPRGNDTLDL